MELFIALVLFIGMIACWLRLPGSSDTSAAPHETDALSASRSAVRRTA